jgi:hypothetical protein
MEAEEVERVISYYDRNTGIIVGEYPISIELNILTQIFKVKKRDPLMYEGYLITHRLSKLLSEYGVICNYDFKKYRYFVECYQKGS